MRWAPIGILLAVIGYGMFYAGLHGTMTMRQALTLKESPLPTASSSSSSGA